MNDMTPVPRHRQAPVSIRSDLALRLLSELTQDGRSQAQVIEDALVEASQKARIRTVEERCARIDAIVRPVHGLTDLTFKEIDDAMWDEYGLPI